MQQRFGIAVKWISLSGVITLHLIIQRQEEGGWLNGVQRYFVCSLAEILCTSPSPGNSRRGFHHEIYSISTFSPMYVFVFVSMFGMYTYFLQSRQPVWVLQAGVLMYHWGFSEIVSLVHWVTGGVLQCTTTPWRSGLCGRQPSAYGHSGAAQCL